MLVLQAVLCGLFVGPSEPSPGPSPVPWVRSASRMPREAVCKALLAGLPGWGYPLLGHGEGGLHLPLAGSPAWSLRLPADYEVRLTLRGWAQVVKLEMDRTRTSWPKSARKACSTQSEASRIHITRLKRT